MSARSTTGFSRRSAVTSLVLAAVFGVLLFGTCYQVALDPQEDVLYLPVTTGGRLGVIERLEIVPEGGSGLLFDLDGTEEPVAHLSHRLVMIAGAVFRVVGRGEARSLEHVGVDLDLGVIGGARDADALLRLPGVGAHHVEILPPDACGADLRCVRSLVGDDHTRLQPRSGDRAMTLDRGETAKLEEGDTLWLGLAPLIAKAGGEGLVLALPRAYESHRGERTWIGDPAPRWPLSGEGPWRLVSERDLFKGKHLPRTRVSRQWEEEVQQLVDEGVLCLEPGLPGSSKPPRVGWRDATRDACVDAKRVHPISEEVAALRERYRYDKSLLRTLEQANDHLADGSYLAAPEVLHFTFDWQFVLTRDGAALNASSASGSYAGEEESSVALHALQSDDVLVQVPTRLLGVWWGTSQQGVPRRILGDSTQLRSAQMGGSPFAPLRMRAGSTSPQLRVLTPVGGLRVDDLLLLTGSPTPVVAEVPKKEGAKDTVEATLLGEVCLEDRLAGGAAVFARLPEGAPGCRTPKGAKRICGARTAQRFHGTALPLGRLTLGTRTSSRVGLEPLAATRPGCLGIARRPDGTYARRGSDSAWRDLVPGRHLEWQGLRVVLRDTADLAAITQPSADGRGDRRIYPFEDDAGQLIGRGTRHYTGLEAALEDVVLEEAGDEGLELTIHGDLQRLVNRALARVMETYTHDDEDLQRMAQGSAVLLDSNTGQVLAAVTWPPFDPNRTSREEALDTARRRLKGLTFNPAENVAFNRTAAAGSTYKLATSIALARAGRLDAGTEATRGDNCSSGLKVYQWKGGRLEPRLDPMRSAKTGPTAVGHFKCDTRWGHEVIPTATSSPRDTFIQAFARSCNVYFGLAGYSLLDAGIALGHRVRATIDRRQSDLGLGDGPLLFSRDQGHPLGLVWPRAVSVAEAVRLNDETSPPDSSENLLWRTFMDLGHRFQYRTRDGVARQQQAETWGPCAPYPTADPDLSWLPGIRAGLGFRYPEVPGPVAFGGMGAWAGTPEDCPDELDDLSTRLAAVEGDPDYHRPMRTLGLVAWGQDVEATALSLAVMTAVVASDDARVPAPWILRSGKDRRRAAEEPMLTTDQQALLRQAMRRVVHADPAAPDGYTGTGQSYFRVLGAGTSRITERVGGKTGTITVPVPASERANAREALRRNRYYACGVPLVDLETGELSAPTLTAEDWELISPKDPVRPAPGFAAGSDGCGDLVPGRVVADGGAYDPIAAKKWLKAHKRISTRGRNETTTSSAFVAAVFDPFLEGAEVDTEDRALLTGAGLSLAVISDYHPRASKEAAAMILSDLDLYFRVRGGAAGP